MITSTIRKLFCLLIFIALGTGYTNGQECVWTRSSVAIGGPGGTTNAAQAAGVVADMTGNIYMAGQYFGDTLSFGSVSVVSADSNTQKIFLAKYNSSGNVLWAKIFGEDSIGNYSLTSMANDRNGNVYIMGIYSGGLTFGTINLPAAISGDEAIFLAKLDSSGNAIWATSVPGEVDVSSARLPSLTTDVSGNVFITGAFYDTLTFGSIILIDSFLSGSYTGALYIVKYDSAGNIAWAKSASGTMGNISSSDMATDAAGNLYVTGSFSIAASFDGINVTGNTGNTSMFLAKYNASGNIVWVNSAGNNANVQGVSVATDGSGNVFAGGYFDSSSLSFGSVVLDNANPAGVTSDLYLAKYDSAGVLTWAKSAGSGGNDELWAMTADKNGNVYMTGTFTTPITFGTSTLTDPSFFVAQYNTSGTPVWAKGTTAYSAAVPVSLFKDNFDNLYVTGLLDWPNFTVDTVTLTDSAYAQESFLSKYTNVASFVPVINAGNDDFLLFPNPAADFITVSAATDKITRVTISNLLGQTVYDQYGNNPEEVVPVAHLQPGIYFLKINNSVIKKFIKE